MKIKELEEIFEGKGRFYSLFQDAIIDILSCIETENLEKLEKLESAIATMRKYDILNGSVAIHLAVNISTAIELIKNKSTEYSLTLLTDDRTGEFKLAPVTILIPREKIDFLDDDCDLVSKIYLTPQELLEVKKVFQVREWE